MGIIFTDILISGDEEPLEIESSVNYTCSSDLNVLSIQWLDSSDNGTVLYNNSGRQELVIPIMEVTRSLHNTKYTCEVEVMLATGVIKLQATITVQVLGKIKLRNEQTNECEFYFCMQVEQQQVTVHAISKQSLTSIV